jgi:peptidyl-prolyl cis-trans isomerase D
MFFGINQFFTGTNDQSVATVNGEEIPLAEYQFQLRQRNTSSTEPSSELKEQVVNSLVQQQLIQDGLGELGLRPSDRTIATELAQNTSFQIDGKFDKERYQAVINSQFPSIQSFEEGFRNNLALTEFSNALELTAINFADADTEAQVRQQAKQNLQTRDFSWVNITTDLLTSSITVTEEEKRARYNSNLKDYSVGKGVKLQYLQLNLDEYLASNQPTEQEVVESYESNLSAHTKPGKRNLEYVTVINGATLETGTLDSIKQKAVELSDENKTIEKISILISDAVAELGEQSVTVTVENGEIGDVTQDIISGLFGNVIADEAFAIEQGNWTNFELNNKDLNLIFVGEVFEEEQVPLEEVRDNISKILAQEKALPKLLEAQEILATVAFENPQSLQPAAAALGIETKTSDWIYEDGSNRGDALISGVPELVSYAFTDTTTAEGYNSDLIESGQDIIIARFAAKSEPRNLAFEDVKDEIEQQLVDQKTRTALRMLGNEILSGAGTALNSETYFAEQGLEVIDSNEDITRNEAMDLYQRRIVNAVFSQAGIGIAAGQTTTIDDDHVAIVWTTKVTEADQDSDEFKQFIANFKSSSTRAISQIEQASLIDLYRENADIEIFNSRL